MQIHTCNKNRSYYCPVKFTKKEKRFRNKNIATKFSSELSLGNKVKYVS